MADKSEQTTQTKPLISKTDVLTTQARRIVFNCLMQGFNAREAAEKAKISYKYTCNMLVKSGINALVEQEQAKIAAKTGITVEYCQRKFAEIAELAQAKGHYGVARACYADLCKTIGGFQTDAPNPKGSQAKELNAKMIEEMRCFAETYYAHKYLAIEQPESIIDVGLNEDSVIESEGDNVDGQG